MNQKDQKRQHSNNEIITVLGQRGSGKSSWVKKHIPNVPRFILWDTLGEYTSFEQFENLQDLFNYVHKNQGGPFQAVYNSIENEDFERVCQIVGAVENCCFIIEEVDTYATPTQCPYELMKLLKIGRHYNISMIFVSRRPAEIHRMITSQSQRFILCKIIEPNDVRYLKSVVGPVADELPGLEILHYVDWKHGIIERGVITW